MITSYRDSVSIVRLRKFVPHDHVPHLTYLVALRLPARKQLEVEDFGDTLPAEDVMVASNAAFSAGGRRPGSSRSSAGPGIESPAPGPDGGRGRAGPARR